MKWYHTIGIFLIGLYFIGLGFVYLTAVDFELMDRCSIGLYNFLNEEYCQGLQSNIAMLDLSNIGFYAGLACVFLYFVFEFGVRLRGEYAKKKAADTAEIRQGKKID